jgi:hypothetical protein
VHHVWHVDFTTFSIGGVSAFILTPLAALLAMWPLCWHFLVVVVPPRRDRAPPCPWCCRRRFRPVAASRLLHDHRRSGLGALVLVAPTPLETQINWLRPIFEHPTA